MSKNADLSDIQSESTVIGTLLCHPEFILHSDYLLPRYFYGEENGCLYWAIQELVKQGIDNIDAHNLSNMIQNNNGVRKALERMNLPSVIEFIELYKDMARDTLDEYKIYVDNVVTFAFKRELSKTLSQIESKVEEKNISLHELNHEVYSELDKLTKRFITSEEITTLGSEIDEIWADIVQRRTADGIYGIPSKYISFMDYFTYEPGELVVIQAKYKQGKSIFLMNEVVHKLKGGIPTLVVDSEMTTRLYTERLLSHLTGISMKKIKNGQYGAEEEATIQKWLQWLKEQPFVHIYDPNMTTDKLYSICKMLQRKINLQFVVYDYFKSNAISTSENYNIMGAKVDFLKNNIAGELGLPVLAACQLNRGGEVADSIKINQYLSVGIKWGLKTQEMIARDGVECGNAYAKIYVNRLGMQMAEDDEDDYIDFVFSGDNMTIVEARQHDRTSAF